MPVCGECAKIAIKQIEEWEAQELAAQDGHTTCIDSNCNNSAITGSNYCASCRLAMGWVPADRANKETVAPFNNDRSGESVSKPVIYIAGPFRAKTPGNQWEQHNNIARAELMALSVWKAGAVALCPHLNTAHFQGALPDEVWLEGDLELVRRCDAVVMVSGWENSEGAQSEKAFAESLDIPVFSAYAPFNAWLSSWRKEKEVAA